jgi:S1-C subfamily serine protease
VAVLVAALIGLGLGGRLVNQDTAVNRLPSLFPSQPAGNGGFGIPPTTAGGFPTAQAQAIAGAVNPSVVDIDAKLGFQQAAAAGTGMVLTSDGEVLTNNHVIAGATTLSGTVVGGKTYTVTVLGSDPTEDVALIKLDGATGLKPIKAGDPAKLMVGDRIVAVGNAGGVGGDPAVVTGTVSALDQSVTASDLGGANAEQLTGLIQINAQLEPGDSGGPLIDGASEVVGMDTAASADSRLQAPTSVGFAIPISRAMGIAGQIAAGHASATIQIGLPGFLGVTISNNVIGATGGAPISGTLPGSPADKLGLKAGDVITEVNGQTVDSPKTLTAILQQRHPGDKVTIGWADSSSKRHTATVTLTTGPAA